MDVWINNITVHLCKLSKTKIFTEMSMKSLVVSKYFPKSFIQVMKNTSLCKGKKNKTNIKNTNYWITKRTWVNNMNLFKLGPYNQYFRFIQVFSDFLIKFLHDFLYSLVWKYYIHFLCFKRSITLYFVCEDNN